MTSIANVILVVGYGLSIAMLLQARSIFRDRGLARFSVLELGTALVAIGWLLRSREVAGIINAVAYVVFAVIWVVTGRRHHAADAGGAGGQGVDRGGGGDPTP